MSFALVYSVPAGPLTVHKSHGFHMERSFLGSHTPSAVSVALGISIGLLVLDSIIELSFVSSTVAWLNNALRHRTFYFTASGTRHHLAALPRHLLVDQVHTTVAAAVAAVAIIGLGGVASLWMRHWAQYRTGWLAEGARYLYYLWLAFNLPALLLTGSALVYVFAVTNAQAGQKIDVANAVGLKGGHYAQAIWTPQSWFSAVLRLKLLREREDIVRHLMVIRGWQYNLILMFILQFGETVLALVDYDRWVRKPTLPEAYGGF